MDLNEIITRLNYVGELLQSLQHFTSSSMHACCCDVCTHITSLQRSCIKRAKQEIGLVSQDLRSNKRLSFPPVNPNLGQSEPAANNILPIQSMSFQSRLSEQHGLRANPEKEHPAPQMLSSTMKDSGLQATASSSDWSASPIYEAESACDTQPDRQMPATSSSYYGVIEGRGPKLFYENNPLSEQHTDGRHDLDSRVERLCMPVIIPGLHTTALRSSTHNLSQSELTSKPGSTPNNLAVKSDPESSSQVMTFAIQQAVGTIPADEGPVTPSEGLWGPPTSLFALQSDTPLLSTPSASRGCSNWSSMTMNTVIDMNSKTLSAPISKTPVLPATEKLPPSVLGIVSQDCETDHDQILQDVVEIKPESEDVIITPVSKETSTAIGKDEMIQQTKGNVKIEASTCDLLKDSDSQAKDKAEPKVVLEDAKANIPHQLETSLANLSLGSDKPAQETHQNRNEMNFHECEVTYKSPKALFRQNQEDVNKLDVDENPPSSIELAYSQKFTSTVQTFAKINGNITSVSEMKGNIICSKSDTTEICEAEKLNPESIETKESIIGLLQHCTTENETGMEPKIQRTKSVEPCKEQETLGGKTSDSEFFHKSNEAQEKKFNAEISPKNLTDIKAREINETAAKTISKCDQSLNDTPKKSFKDMDKENKCSLLLTESLLRPDKLTKNLNDNLDIVEKSQMINESGAKDIGEICSSPRKPVRSHQAIDCFLNPKSLLQDQSLKCMSNLEFSPRKSHPQQTVEYKFSDLRHSLHNQNVISSQPEILKNCPEQLSSPQRRPAMGVRRSLDMFKPNRNNNTNNLNSEEKRRSLFPFGKTWSSCYDQGERTTGGNIIEECITSSGQKTLPESPMECKKQQSTKKLAWGAPAYCASQYLFGQSKEKKVNSKNVIPSTLKPTIEKDHSPNLQGHEIDGIEQTVPIKRSHKIECCMFQEPSNLDKESTVGSKLVSRHNLEMIMESPSTSRLKHHTSFNSSLPVSLLKTDAQSQDFDFEGDEKMESYEGNQSFPKTASSDKLKQGKSCHTTPTLFAEKSKIEDNKRSNILGAEKTPRNRRSIFGFSPPDQHQHGRQRSPPNQRVNKQHSLHAQGSPAESSSQESQQAPQSSASQDQVSSGSEGKLSQTRHWHDLDAASLDALWDALDVSTMLAQPPSLAPPSLQEVLFNTVTGSLCIVDIGRSGKIVSVNESFQLLIGLHEKVVGQRLFRFLKFTNKPESLSRSCAQSFIRGDGSVLSVAGVMAKCVDSRGLECPVSVWMLPLVTQPNLAVCVVDIMTPLTSDLRLVQQGQIVSLSDSFEEMLGVEGQMCGVTELDISKIKIAQNVRLETHDFEVPVTVVIDKVEEEGPSEEGELPVYQGTITLYGNLCGLLVVNLDGRIIFSDDYFRMFLGYNDLSEQAELWEIISEVTKVGEDGDERTLSVCGDNAILDISSNRSQLLDTTLKDVNHLRISPPEDAGEVRPKLFLPSSCFGCKEKSFFEEFSSEEDHDESQSKNKVNEEENKDFVDNSNFQNTKMQRNIGKIDRTPQGKIWTCPKDASTPHKATVKFRDLHQEQTEDLSQAPDVAALDHGIFNATFIHASGDKFSGSFKVGSIMTSASNWQYCVWVYLHITDENEESSWHRSVASNSQEELVSKELDSHNSNDDDNNEREDAENINTTVDPSLGQIIMDHAGLNQSHNAASEEDILDLESAIAGAFRKKYFVRQALGQGSFGFVRRAMAIDCKKSVIVKFIKKRNMFTDSWTVDEDSGQKIPLEVAILKDLNSEYIIKVLDVYQNSDFVQMVMEDFGDVDLFDFIDQVCLDEPLACHLFHQILWGVDYLHNCSIVHRDIKDENVVLRKDLRCKLIDFGSAVYLLPGNGKFTRFRGTMEYCSPEVFNGKSYRGPELDMWALGVTLYTMVYRVNPFSVDDMPGTFSQLEFPDAESDEDVIGNGDMHELLYGLLEQDPTARYTMDQALRSEWLRMIVNLSDYCWEDLFGGEMQADQLMDVSGFAENS